MCHGVHMPCYVQGTCGSHGIPEGQEVKILCTSLLGISSNDCSNYKVINNFLCMDISVNIEL